MFDALLAYSADLFDGMQTMLFDNFVQPLLFELGWMTYTDDAYSATGWVLIGVLQVTAMFLFLRPLEAWRPVEQWQSRDAVRVDILYTLIQKLGIFTLMFFLFLQPLFDKMQGWLRLHGIVNIELDDLWPGVTSQPLVSFFLYFILLDFADYWYHRGQHRFKWWWELHAVHHSQHQLSFWSDDRNHLLDSALHNAFFGLTALIIGVPPSQFVWLVVLRQFMQSLQHVNARLDFGKLMERLLVSPKFHRLHHAIEIGHSGTYHGCNFGVLLPWWDMLFRTSNFHDAIAPTGIQGQPVDRSNETQKYGAGFWQQQWYGLIRVAEQIGSTLRPSSN